MALDDELGAAAAAARAFAAEGEELAGVVAAEPAAGRRVYLCAYAAGAEHRWLALGADGVPIGDRVLLRDAVSIMALCELAEESAGGGDVSGLRAQLAALREAEAPEGIEDAEEAAAALEATLEEPPRLARPAYLDAIGAAVTRLERALGEVAASPFAEAMKAGSGAVDELVADVERAYKRPLG
jgi:hypothetical protein